MKIENRSIQIRNKNCLMHSQLIESIIPKIIKVFVMLLDDIVCIEEVIAQKKIMSECNTHIMFHKTVLSYPSSLEKQVMKIPRFLQETRIRWIAFIKHEIFVNVYSLRICIK